MNEQAMQVEDLTKEQIARVEAERAGWRVVVPAFDHIVPDVEHMLDMLQRNGITVIRYVGNSDIARARSLMGSQMLADESVKRILWIDSDQLLDARDCVRLLLSRREFVTAVAPQRKMAGKLLIDWGPQGSPESVKIGKDGGEYRAFRCGFGAVAMDRSVLEKAAQDLPQVTCDRQVFYPMFLPSIREDDQLPTGWAYLGEDYAFCERVAEAGVQLFVDTSLRVFHFGRHPFAWEDCLLAPRRFLTLELEKSERAPEPGAN